MEYLKTSLKRESYGITEQRDSRKMKKTCLWRTEVPAGTCFKEEEMWVEQELAKRIIPICLSSGGEKRSKIYS